MLRTPLNPLVSRLILSVFAFACGVVVAGEPAPQKDAAPVTLGREFMATPWAIDVGEAPFEVVPYKDISRTAQIPLNAVSYTIDPEVVASGYSYFFKVNGIDEEFIVGSVLNLSQLCHELGVIEELKTRNKGKEFATGLGNEVKGIGTGLGNLVTHPGQSMRGLGTRIRRFGRSVERTVGGEGKVGEDSSGANRSLLGEGPAGAERRRLAYELGVDVYTSNPAMQKALIEMAQVRVAGGMLTWVIPYGIGMLSSFNPLFGDEQTEALIRDNDPYELRRQVGISLEPVVGMGREDQAQPLNRLLMNPNYTPRTLAYIGYDVALMREVGNIALVLNILAKAGTPEEADRLALELRLFSFLNQRVQPLADFVPFENAFAAMGRNGVFYTMFYGDTLRPWDTTTAVFDGLYQTALRLRARGMEIWCVGDVDPNMAAAAAKMGVVVRQNILDDPVFFPKKEQKR